MRIRVHNEITTTSPSYYQAMIVEAIEELEDEYKHGEIETAAYLMKKKALVKML